MHPFQLLPRHHIFLLLALNFPTPVLAQAPLEIHSEHFCYGYPLGSPITNDLVIRRSYALSNNDFTKLADWVSYRVRSSSLAAEEDTNRSWSRDPFLDDQETLEPDDYRDAFITLSVDRGHQAPLASFQGTPDWAETNFLSNITPQRSDLNRGVWLQLENHERNLVRAGFDLCVMTGPLFERPMPPLPRADEFHLVPSGYWKVWIAFPQQPDQPIRAAGFIFDQETPRTADLSTGLVPIRVIEQRARLQLLWQLSSPLQDSLETTLQSDWINLSP